MDVIKLLNEKIQEFERWEKENKSPSKSYLSNELKETITDYISEFPVVGFNYSGR